MTNEEKAKLIISSLIVSDQYIKEGSRNSSADLEYLIFQITKALDETSKINWPSDEEIKEEAKHEDSDGYFGFITGCRWLKERVGSK